ncbi:DUF1523 family protein [Gymnodinialimonas ceratoperidinii]|uniref:DUF1523 family protein n=1 Tax=Gymnodinialimonas ceratoperidinii TaxID=2856823 RepID=A0A8F6TWM1_9RHOB|nr:DUF1523 family protein [Gymnodinialimonas ceratoperidinii]QXT39514.1 DUF1523 family protein [Gymnodinialimonas ceratoperidinii]
MRWARIFILVILLGLLGAFAHYTLPQRDVVRIVDTQLQLTEISGASAWFYAQSDSGAAGTSVQRDVRIISAVRADGSPIDYRNEDTGIFGWPPYFKIDSQDLQTEAQDLRSTRDAPVWVAITHYGWRSNLLSSYPNAISITRVDGPETTLFPWMPLVILAVLALLLFMIWRMWERFEDRVLVPARDGAAVRWAKLKDRMSGR